MKLLFVLFLSIILVSCVGTQELQKSLNKQYSAMGYIHDSEIINQPRFDSVHITIHSNRLDSSITVTKTKGYFLPFIFINYGESHFDVSFGHKSDHFPYTDFFANSFIDESKRSALYSVCSEQKDNLNYHLEINIDSCNTRSKYKATVFLMCAIYAVSYREAEIGFPAETNMYCTAKLSKGDSVFFNKTYSTSLTQPFLNSNSGTIPMLRAYFVANMSEAVSLCTKKIIENIIYDVNQNIRREADPNETKLILLSQPITD